MPHIRATIQHSRPARVTRAKGPTFGLPGAGIKDNGGVRHVAAVRLGPALRNCSGSCVVKGFAITCGGEVLIRPVARWHGGIIETRNEQRGHVLIFTLSIQIAPVWQTNDGGYGRNLVFHFF